MTVTDGRPRALQFFRSATATRPQTDLKRVESGYDTTPIANGIITTGEDGSYPEFAGPDDLTSLWMQVVSGPGGRTKLDSTGQVLFTPAYAPMDSPVFTGNPTAPTPSLGDSDTSIATTAFVAARALQGDIDHVHVDEHPPSPQRYRLPGDPDWTLGIQRLLDAGHKAVYIPPSSTPYDISATINQPLGVDDITLAQGATVRATAAISGPMLNIYDSATQRRFGSLSGGTWDCNNLAQDGVALNWHWGHSVDTVVIKDHLRDGIIVGSPTSSWGSAQHKLRNIEVLRTPGTALPVGSRGVVIAKSTDGTCISTIVQSAETSFHTESDGNQFYSCHGWSSASNINKTTFYDNGGNNDYYGCCADSPSTYGWHIKQWNIRIIGGFSLQPVPASDNLSTAIHIDCGGPDFAGVIANHFIQGGSTSRWMKDFDGTVPYPGLSVYGNTAENVVTSSIGGFQSLGSRMRIDAAGSPTSVPLTVNADGTGTADLLRVLKGGAQRFSIDTYGVAYGVGAFYSDKVRMGNGTAIGGGVMSGTGSPDGVITGAAGDAWIRTDGTTGSWIYRCTGGTAWSAVL